MRHDTAIIIPVYNEGSVIAQTISEALKAYPFVICINDGSQDNSSSEIAKSGAVLIEHAINLGQGGALQTGIEYALQFPDVHYFVTFDADGQHDIKDVKAMIKKMKAEQLDVVLGSRFLENTTNISAGKKVLLKSAIQFTNFFSRVRLTDTHNGLRVFNRPFAEALHITMPGMAHASEIVDKVGRGDWRYAEAPVAIRYDDYSRSKGQSMLNSINIVIDLLVSRAGK